MRKILILAKREFLVSVRTKSFIIGLIIAPIFMGGGIFAFALLKDKVDINDRRIVVLDQSGLVGEHIKQMAENRNQNEINDPDFKSK